MEDNCQSLRKSSYKRLATGDHHDNNSVANHVQITTRVPTIPVASKARVHGACHFVKLFAINLLHVSLRVHRYLANGWQVFANTPLQPKGCLRCAACAALAILFAKDLATTGQGFANNLPAATAKHLPTVCQAAPSI
jgi:hypothetical protein